MLFDEATSALDSESEVVVQRSIDELLKVKDRPTSVVVAHRLSTIVGCDCICVLQRGKLIESGTHSELMQNKDGMCVIFPHSFLYILLLTDINVPSSTAGIFFCSSYNTCITPPPPPLPSPHHTLLLLIPLPPPSPPPLSP